MRCSSGVSLVRAPSVRLAAQNRGARWKDYFQRAEVGVCAPSVTMFGMTQEHVKNESSLPALEAVLMLSPSHIYHLIATVNVTIPILWLGERVLFDNTTTTIVCFCIISKKSSHPFCCFRPKSTIHTTFAAAPTSTHQSVKRSANHKFGVLSVSLPQAFLFA